MTVNRQNFNQMVATQPQLIARLTTTLAERIFVMQRQLANSQLTDPVEKMVDMLALQVEKAKIVISNKTTFQTDITPQDIATMCGLTQQEQALYLHKFMMDPHVKLVENKILVPDCLEIVKQAAFYRKQCRK